MTENADRHFAEVRRRLARGGSVDADELLASALELREQGDLPAALDVLVARWFLIPDDPSGPWDVVATLRDLRQPVLAAVCRFMTYRQLSRPAGGPDGSGGGEDDDWAGNALAFAFSDLVEAGALTSAAALLPQFTDPAEREECRAMLPRVGD